MSQSDQTTAADDSSVTGGRDLTCSDATARHDDANNGQHEGGKARVRTKSEYLHALDSAAQLVAIGVLTPAKANSVKGIYDTILKHLEPASVGGVSPLGAAELDAFRAHPELLRLLAPLLSDDTIAKVMQTFKDEPSPEQ